MSLDFFELVDGLDDKDLLKLHESIISNKSYNNLVDLTDIGDDLDKIRNVVPIALQKMSYEDVYSIAPKDIKVVLSEYVDVETAALGTDSEDSASIIPDIIPETPEQMEAKVFDLASIRGESGRVLPQNREEIKRLLATLNKMHGRTISQLASLINLSESTVTDYVRKYIKEHPYEEHRWNPVAKDNAEKMAELSLTKAAGTRADMLVESYLSLGEWVMETYSISALSFGLNVKEYIRMVAESYDPESHIFTMDLIRKKDQYFNEVQAKSLRITELQLLIIHICIGHKDYDLLNQLIQDKVVE